MKKFFSILLAVMMIMTIAAPVFADDPVLGSIKLKNVSIEDDGQLSDGYRYDIYRIFDLSYSKVNGTEAFSYTVNTNWDGFFADGSAALNYVTFVDGYAKWNTTDDDDTVADFAKLALDYAQANGITPVASTDDIDYDPNVEDNIDIDATNKTLTFTNLVLGYYLIDSNVGVLCGLTTTNPDAEVTVKNAAPTIEKKVREDDRTDIQYWVSENSSAIGETVDFRVVINVHAGAQNYILHDHIAEGFSNVQVTKVEHVPFQGTPHTVDPSDYTYVLPTADSTCQKNGKACTFEVKLDDEVFADVETNDQIIIYYSATLDTDADVTAAGNVNTAFLEYGEGHFTTESSTVTRTFAFDLIKVNETNMRLDGAAFKIYDAATGGNEIKFIEVKEAGVVTHYRLATAEEITNAALAIRIDVANGQTRIEGLDNGSYYLEEVETPDGYNTLTSRQKVTISDSNLEDSVGQGVNVVNKTGAVLPSTGGLGTTLFITIGGILAMGAGVVLFARKRMSQIAE